MQKAASRARESLFSAVAKEEVGRFPYEVCLDNRKLRYELRAAHKFAIHTITVHLQTTGSQNNNNNHNQIQSKNNFDGETDPSPFQYICQEEGQGRASPVHHSTRPKGCHPSRSVHLCRLFSSNGLCNNCNYSHDAIKSSSNSNSSPIRTKTIVTMCCTKHRRSLLLSSNVSVRPNLSRMNMCTVTPTS